MLSHLLRTRDQIDKNDYELQTSNEAQSWGKDGRRKGDYVPACEVRHLPCDHCDEEGAGGAGGQDGHGVLPQAGVHQFHLVLPLGENGGVHILRLYPVHLQE